VGGDIGRIEKEFFAENFIIAPAERIIFETSFANSGTYALEHRGKKIGEVVVEGDAVGAKNISPLRQNAADYAIIRDNFQKFLDQPIDKKLRISIGMKGMGEMRRGMEHKDGKGNMMGGNMEDMMKKEKSLGGEGVKHDEDGGIEWEDAMAQMNKMSNDKMMEWMLIDETDAQNPKKNMEIDWTFKKDQFVKIEIFNDPKSMHPMQHPIHFHGQRFVVLTRNGEPNDNLQWKDTTLLTNGERIEILLNTTNPGKWMTHCHIAEHLHAGMMFNFKVK
jgi:FtsP/CotA-like multicopper oxidase with cupredoxin domain